MQYICGRPYYRFSTCKFLVNAIDCFVVPLQVALNVDESFDNSLELYQGLRKRFRKMEILLSGSDTDTPSCLSQWQQHPRRPLR